MVLLGCGKVEELREAWYPPTPYNTYLASLRAVNLDQSALGRAWLDASERVAEEALPVGLPYHAVNYSDPTQPTAQGYLLDVARGQRIEVAVLPDFADSAQVFVDLFRIPSTPDRPLHHITSADSTMTLAAEAGRDLRYLLRIQPELLAAGRYTVTIRLAPSLVFPVSGKDSDAILSFFGASRDGGRRRHHGIDIFADRGTPVVATAAGRVTRVQNTRIGGKVVWLRDQRRSQVYYYAHLDSQMVRRNQRVAPGDTLGTVGNTGNARTTPPHLHFGIYSNGPVDPYLFVHQPIQRPAPLRVDTTLLGAWVAYARTSEPLRESPSRQATTVANSPPTDVLRIIGGSGQWYKVKHPTGHLGFIRANAVRPLPQAAAPLTLATSTPVRLDPTPTSPPVAHFAEGEVVQVLGRHDRFLRVRDANNQTGWIAAD